VASRGESTVADDRPAIGRRLGLSRHSLAGALLVGAIVLAGVVLALALGSSKHTTGAAHAHTQAAKVLGAKSASSPAGAPAAGAPSGARGRAAQSVHAGAPTVTGRSPQVHVAKPGLAATANGEVAAGTVSEVPDPEEAKSFPAPATVHHSLATKPSKAAEEVVAPGAPSNAEVRAELAQMHAAQRAAAKQQAKTLSIVPGGDSIGGNGQLPIPAGVPEVVQRVIAGANAITDFPYVFGGGHASFVSNSYDCSGSVSYALAAGGLLGAPETSGSLESWGTPGPGKWITVYANAGHTYMYVNIGGRWMRYDTVGRSGVFASRWQPEIRSNAGFVARHWPGL
jgi:cell wall-associated NlpC family hydrolase